MTRETNGTAPDLIVLGRDHEGKARAARFPANQANLVVPPLAAGERKNIGPAAGTES
jgi:hypothetical protein